ncbi:argininosuccinate synthase [Eggerthellaceae bacterium zg-1084]|uniref:Argininosuccinate synthase n=1 Tax=Berryella wangjianweii TaxID=2734634 RepID=A0A6M8JA71_9ACTN|nr:argininosuccinate synthase [Berryella wangjianweii]NPD30809.1 argininosuccinate synthase [Berryella wangjianweii]QKF07712.1 argininosuccinate synthase [Berryella wangjianweii]
MADQKEKVVLAYSGGLDTSICIKWLQEEKNLDVIAVVGEVGQEHSGLESVKEKALRTGAIECYVVDMREDFVNDNLVRALAANALYENEYPLLSALSRPTISKSLVDIAHKHGATYVAHGCTGKGNDQVRFEASIAMLDPSLKVIAPVREWEFKTRPEEMEWAEAHGVEVPTTKATPYSIDDNLWGRAIECGVLEDPWNEPPADIYTMTVAPEDAPDAPEYIEVSFKAGVPCALDGKEMSYIDIIYQLNEVAGRNGYGRLDIVENRLVGVKSRECYEQPAALSLITAHKALESLCLEREVLHYKLGVEQQWATCVYYGQWFAPLKQALDAFLAHTQQCVTGDVRLKFYKGTCVVVGRRSPYSLYSYELATYDREDEFDHEAAKGFIELNTLSAKVWAQNRMQRNGTIEG